ncbi:MAG: tetratricopeptide repeat protein, partial [Anaerolineales bacterium]|nr:tetratricopeptide repeat protein [Anaerolineales bacterium]
MARSDEIFAQLLTEGVYQISFREIKTLQAIQDELGYALDKKGGASIEYWRKGHVPAKLSDIENLAREIVRRGRLKRDWLEKFLVSAGHPAPTPLCDHLFPPPQPAPAETTPPKAPLGLDSLPLDKIPEPAPLPAGSLMPLNKNPLFVGRQEDLLALASALKAGGATAISQVETAAATGLGGIGKTQLASEFVHRYGQFFDGGVFWLSFAEANAIPAEIAACGGAGALELRLDFGAYPLNDQVRLVQAAWQSPRPRLLIFDNCEDPALLAQWRPPSGGCRVLVTSRRGDWELALGVKTLALGVLSRPESVALLRQHCPDADEAILDAIAEELGDLPLALHLAGSYLYRYRRAVTPSGYLAQLQDPQLLHHPSLQSGGISPTGHVQHVGRTFALSYDRLDPADEIDALARSLLVRVAHFAPGEPIWYKLLVKTLGLDPDRPASALKADQAFARLIELGLIETEQDKVLRMHRLVAAFVRDVAKDEVEATQKAVEAVVFEETAQVNRAGLPLPLLAWQFHLRSVVDVAQARQDEEGARLCTELGQHLWQIGDYEGALPYYQKALQIRDKRLGQEHLATAQSLNNLGHLLYSQGKLVEARSYLEQALAIREKLLGEDHIDLTDSLNYLGQWYYTRNDFVTAKAIFERAVAISANELGETHPLTGEFINNLGMCFLGSNDFDGALPHLLQALIINEQALGSEHPDTAMNLNNIAFALSKGGQQAEAQPYYERALAIRQKVLGDDHPDTGQSLKNLGALLLDQGNLTGARAHLEAALQVYHKAYHDPHPRTALCLDVLGELLQRQGELVAAQTYFEQALAIRQAALRDDHPLRALSLKNLGLLLASQG